MLKKNKWNMILSCLVTLLPMLCGVILWNGLPDPLITHWGIDGKGDGWSGKAFAVFGLPMLLLALHLLGLCVTLLENRKKPQNAKVLGLVFWIIPTLSLFVNGILYATALGKGFEWVQLIPALIGFLLILIGNYLPKATQNRSFGIKISWTLCNEENWNRTHRLGGKVWVVGGLALLFSVFLPFTAVIGVMIGVILAAVLIPLMYSYHIYKQHQKTGVAYAAAPKTKAERISSRVCAVLLILILIGVSILMGTGKLAVSCEDTAFTVHATYWTDIEVSYDEIDTIVYRRDLEVGERIAGFGSAKLLLGTFQNEEFGSYTLYAYTGARDYVVLTSGERTLVIGMKHVEDVDAIYDTISQKIEEKKDGSTVGS